MPLGVVLCARGTMADDPNAIHHSDLVVDEIRENPVGPDERHLDQEYVRFRNEGTAPLDIAGWTVENEAGDAFTFPDDTELAPGERVTLHSGPGTNTEFEFFWGADRPRWRNTGDTVRVRDADGTLRIRESYNE